MTSEYQKKVHKAKLSGQNLIFRMQLKKIKERTEKVGIERAREMKRQGYDDSEIVEETGYHL